MLGSWIDAALLGVVEGLTEFIPVSSTGHLILVGSLLGVASPVASVFNVFIQTGAIFAVLWVYRRRIIELVRAVFVPSRVMTSERMLALALILAFLPAAAVGVIFHDFIKTVLFSPLIVAWALIIGGAVMLWVERHAPVARIQKIEAITPKIAFQIGLCQIAALIPGVSRSGASIVGAQFFGVSRAAATEFSFFLAIPVIIGASFFDLYKSRHLLSVSDWPIFAIGTITAFLSAMIVIRWLIAYVSRYGFAHFAYYRIGVGCLFLMAMMLGFIPF